MVDSTFLKIEKSDGIARVYLSRPKHNVLNIDMMKELNAELERFIEDRDVKGVFFLGDGPSWCAGVEVEDHKPELVDGMICEFSRIFELFQKLEAFTVAVVHGACLGGGMELAIASDMIIAGKSAVFGQPEVRLGFFPPYAAVRLPELVGPQRAMEICITGNRYSADEAFEMGMISRSVKDEELMTEMEKISKSLRASSPLIIRLNKRAVRENLGKPFSEAMAGANDLFLNTLMKTEDTLEGIKSFEEKRKPVWGNR